MLTMQQVTTYYAKSRPSLSLSLTLQKGDFCVVVGANGSGKTTLFKTLTGEITPLQGKITLNQREITSLPTHLRAKHISSVIQDPLKGTVPEMTLLENLCLSLYRGEKASFANHKDKKAFLTQRVAALNLGLEHAMDKPLGILSGGQRQVIATLMATLTSPLLLLLDEHVSALDPKTQQSVMNLTKKIILKEKLTCMMITHHLPDAIEYGNRLIMLHQGRIVLDLNAQQKKALSVPKLLSYFHDNPQVNKAVRVC